MANYIDDLRQGDEVTIKIDMSNVDEIPVTPPTDLTGFKFWFTLKKDVLDGDELAALQVSTTAGDSDNDDPINGIVYLTIESDVMATVEAGTYFYDLQMKRPSATGKGIKTILPPIGDPIDPIIVYPQVTKAVA